MKNPFEKNDHKVLIAGVAIGSAVAGAAAYLLMTETGAKIRQELTGHFNRIRAAVMGIQTAPLAADHAADYLHHEHPKAPKSDVGTLKKHAAVINGQDSETPGE